MARQITKRRKMTPERRRELDLKYRTFKERSKRGPLKHMEKIMGGYYAPYISGGEEFGATKGPLGGKYKKYKDMSKFSTGGGCPFREVGAKSDIQGIKDIQTTGKKFIGVR